MPKTDDIHTNLIWQRIDAVTNLILENERYMESKRFSELSAIVADKFNVSSRTAQRYIEEARKEVRKLGRANKKKAFSQYLRRHELLYIRALGVKDNTGKFASFPDHRLARDINNDFAEIHQLKTNEIKHTGEVTNKIIFVEDLDE